MLMDLYLESNDAYLRIVDSAHRATTVVGVTKVPRPWPESNLRDALIAVRTVRPSNKLNVNYDVLRIWTVGDGVARYARYCGLIV